MGVFTFKRRALPEGHSLAAPMPTAVAIPVPSAVAIPVPDPANQNWLNRIFEKTPVDAHVSNLSLTPTVDMAAAAAAAAAEHKNATARFVRATEMAEMEREGSWNDVATHANNEVEARKTVNAAYERAKIEFELGDDLREATEALGQAHAANATANQHKQDAREARQKAERESVPDNLWMKYQKQMAGESPEDWTKRIDSAIEEIVKIAKIEFINDNIDQQEAEYRERYNNADP